ncbi:hypothetical protein [Nocardia sp. CA-290969]|uniref:hypothetical protein n=1 Tax=Nocardia sp. CA-290969 TaxID=3239986 RepID=UPI003D91A317
MDTTSQPAAEADAVRDGFIALSRPKGGKTLVSADQITIVEPCDPGRGQARARVAVTGGHQRYCLETVDEVMSLIARAYQF